METSSLSIVYPVLGIKNEGKTMFFLSLSDYIVRRRISGRPIPSFSFVFGSLSVIKTETLTPSSNHAGFPAQKGRVRGK